MMSNEMNMAMVTNSHTMSNQSHKVVDLVQEMMDTCMRAMTEMTA